MIRRFLDALQRELADQSSARQFRPNELNREVARSERLRRETRQANAAVRQDASSPEAERVRRERQVPPAAPAVRAAPLAASLKSRSELRRAILLKEILGPPAALRWPRDGDPDL